MKESGIWLTVLLENDNDSEFTKLSTNPHYIYGVRVRMTEFHEGS